MYTKVCFGFSAVLITNGDGAAGHRFAGERTPLGLTS
jgi:hypothetical protein